MLRQVRAMDFTLIFRDKQGKNLLQVMSWTPCPRFRTFVQFRIIAQCWWRWVPGCEPIARNRQLGLLLGSTTRASSKTGSSFYPFVPRKKMWFRPELYSLMLLAAHLGKLSFMIGFNGHNVQEIHLEDYQSWQRTMTINQTQKITNDPRHSLLCIQTNKNDSMGGRGLRPQSPAICHR